jgi:hypothetical protein
VNGVHGSTVIQHWNVGRTKRARWRLRGAVALLCACRSAVDPPLPRGAELMIAPPVYATWWAMTETCSDLRGPLDRVERYRVPNAATVPYPGVSDATGYWSFASDRIVLAGESVLDGGAVRHEMLHALLQNGRHLRPAFLERCGGVVDCGRECIAGADPLPPLDPATPTISPDQLSLTISIAPAAPSMGVDGGFFAVTVGVTNATDHPALVVLPNRTDTDPGTTFEYHLQGPFGGQSSGELALDPGVLRFAPHEIKRQVFDFRIGYDSAARELRPGTYSVGATFGRNANWTYRTVTLRP